MRACQADPQEATLSLLVKMKINPPCPCCTGLDCLAREIICAEPEQQPVIMTFFTYSMYGALFVSKNIF